MLLTYLVTFNQVYIMTNTKRTFAGIFAILFLFSIVFMSCKKDDNTDGGSGNTTLKVTDAPFDDASVSAVFVTVTDVKFDGVSVSGFTKTTFDIAALQNGTSRIIGNFNLEGRTYNSVTFVLDYSTDAQGNAPGSYVLTTNGTKHALSSTSNEITVTKSFDIQANGSNTIVADFDLRKMIVHQSGSGSDQYDFATTAELQSSVRVLLEANSGVVAGKITDGISSSTKVVAYAYKLGTFNRATEIQAQGTSGIQFKNAVSSASLNAMGEYQLHFLESGKYEVHFASYKDVNSDGQMEFAGTFTVLPSILTLDFLNLTIAANTTVTLNGTVTAVVN